MGSRTFFAYVEREVLESKDRRDRELAQQKNSDHRWGLVVNAIDAAGILAASAMGGKVRMKPRTVFDLFPYLDDRPREPMSRDQWDRFVTGQIEKGRT